MLRTPRVSPLTSLCLSLALALIASVARAGAVPALDHVMVIVMENKNPEQVRTAAYIARSIANGSSFSDFRALAHPSQPNYLALWSGSTQGVTNNNSPAPGVPWTTENLGHLCESAGLSWRAYSEDLPAVGAMDVKANHGLYARKHEPWTNFGNLNHQNERPHSDLAVDIAAGQLPALAFVIPNNNNNMHNDSVAAGDAWLARQVPAMLEAVGPRGIVVLTWDENDHGSPNRILTVIQGAMVKKGFVADGQVTHYTLLRTICDALRLPAPGAAVTETPITTIWSDAAAEQVPARPDGTR